MAASEQPWSSSDPTPLPRVETPLEQAQASAKRTSEVLSEYRGFVATIKELHVENGYVPKLRAIFRGTL